MATERQCEIDQAFHEALNEFGVSTDTEFLTAVTSERTKADYDEIVEALASIYVHRNPPRVPTKEIDPLGP